MTKADLLSEIRLLNEMLPELKNPPGALPTALDEFRAMTIIRGVEKSVSALADAAQEESLEYDVRRLADQLLRSASNYLARYRLRTGIASSASLNDPLEDWNEPGNGPDGGAPVLAPIGPKVPPRAGADAKPIPPEDWCEGRTQVDALGRRMRDEDDLNH